MKNTTLVIMAAGIGSRFGKGTKQLTPVGPSGELIMDYSIHDAVKAGFNKVVLVIRKSIRDEFRSAIGNRIEKIVDVEYAFQELFDLPNGFDSPKERTKPWGTGQALFCCRDVVKTPFAVINADDYYGIEPYRLVHDRIISESESDQNIHHICMAGFKLGNTLSENGAVTRGICCADEDHNLISIDETKNIYKCEKGALVKSSDGEKFVPFDTPVSMNLWGFKPRFMDSLEEGFTSFLKEAGPNDLKSEFLLPSHIDNLLKTGKAKVKILDTQATWVGVTFQEDKEYVRDAFKNMVKNGVYGSNLYDDILR